MARHASTSSPTQPTIAQPRLAIHKNLMGQPASGNATSHAPQPSRRIQSQPVIVPPRRSNRLKSRPRSQSPPQNPPKQLLSKRKINTPLGRDQTDSLERFKRRLAEPVKRSSKKSLKPTPLTIRNLQTLEKMARRKPTGKISPITSIGLPSEAQQSLEPGATTDSSNSKSSVKTLATTDPGFALQASDNGILTPADSKPPINLQELQRKLNKPCDKAFTEEEFNDFSYHIRKAPNEMSTMVETMSLIKRYEHSSRYRRSCNQTLDDFPKDMGFNNGLSPPKPDMIQGLDISAFLPVPVRRVLLGSAVPFKDRDSIALAHLAGEWKGPGKDTKHAETQAAYDAACLVFAINAAFTYTGSPNPEGHAHVLTFATDGVTLRIFAHYSTLCHGQVLYHQFPLSSTFLIPSFEDYQTSMRRIWNAQDIAKENAEALRDKIVARWKENEADSPVLNDEEDREINEWDAQNPNEPSLKLRTGTSSESEEKFNPKRQRVGNGVFAQSSNR